MATDNLRKGIREVVSAHERIDTSEPGTGRRSYLSSVSSKIRALSSVLSNRQLFARGFGGSFDGITFNGRRDEYTTLGYKRLLTVKDYRDRYQRGGIAERIVETFPRAIWAGGASIIEDPDPGVETQFEQETISIFDRLNVWSVIMRAHILKRLGNYGCILIGATDTTDDLMTLSTPLGRLSGPDDIIFLKPLAEDHAKIRSVVTDTSDPRFGKPLLYQVALGTPTSYQMFGTNESYSRTNLVEVHWSRVIHIAEGTLEDEVYGKPCLRGVWNLLDDLRKVTGGGAEASWRRMDPGMTVEIDPEKELGPEDRTALEEEIDDYYNGLERSMIMQGAKVNLLSGVVDKFGPNVTPILQLIAGTTGNPIRLLIGTERGELASTQDRANWNDRIYEQRREVAIPLVNQILDRFIDHGALSSPAQKEIVWPELDELSKTEKATVVMSLASANASQVNAGGGLIITSDEIRDATLGLEPLEEVVSTGDNTTAADDTVINDSNPDTSLDDAATVSTAADGSQSKQASIPTPAIATTKPAVSASRQRLRSAKVTINKRARANSNNKVTFMAR